MTPEPKTVRLLEPIEGQYCKLKAGELVKIQAMPKAAEDSGVMWLVERETWINSTTISNVLCAVPDHVLIVEEPNDPILPTEGAATDS